MTTVVRGIVECSLAGHVDRYGQVWDDARSAVHRSLATIPPGLAVRVRLGRAQRVADGALDLLAELAADAPYVEVVGSDDRGVAHAVQRLTELLERAVPS